MIEVIKILRLEDVFYYHDLVITSTGGDSGVRDRSLVESAYYSAFQSFDGIDLFKTLEDKASRIGFGLAKNHGFVYCLCSFLSFFCSAIGDRDVQTARLYRQYASPFGLSARLNNDPCPIRRTRADTPSMLACFAI